MKNTHKLFPPILLAFILIVAGNFLLSILGIEPNKASVLRLSSPAFLTMVAEAQGTLSPLFLASEAGISAYAQTTAPINFSHIKPAFRTVEVENEDYLIGSVSVTGFPETFDPHVYVNKEGWLIAYYPLADPVSKIVEWNNYNGTTIQTKLGTALDKIADQGQFSISDLSFYDFRYPNATHLMFIMETQTAEGQDSFEIILPETFSYDEVSWFLGTEGTYENAWLKLNGATIGFQGWEDHYGAYGRLTTGQLIPGLLNTITVERSSVTTGGAYGGLVIIYREAQ